MSGQLQPHKTVQREVACYQIARLERTAVALSVEGSVAPISSDIGALKCVVGLEYSWRTPGLCQPDGAYCRRLQGLSEAFSKEKIKNWLAKDK